ncbi:MAG: hypothetical protein AUH85_00510 [Chloroflexi bacterium 13_1_40CM_4_68_4]|nr:MAG: hypothetical protein AUH85_00510 [Chloroflexi bacterium 13_1_40CM_4_68_4]
MYAVTTGPPAFTDTRGLDAAGVHVKRGHVPRDRECVRDRGERRAIDALDRDDDGDLARKLGGRTHRLSSSPRAAQTRVNAASTLAQCSSRAVRSR